MSNKVIEGLIILFALILISFGSYLLFGWASILIVVGSFILIDYWVGSTKYFIKMTTTFR